MDALSRWLSAKNYRTTVVNILMLTAVLAMAGSAGLFKAVGGGAVVIAGAYFLIRAIGLTFRSWAGANFYQIALIWIPGVLAIGLAVAGLSLVTGSEPLSLGYVLGVILFGTEVAMLAIAGGDLEGDVSASLKPVEAV